MFKGSSRVNQVFPIKLCYPFLWYFQLNDAVEIDFNQRNFKSEFKKKNSFQNNIVFINKNI